MAEKNEIGKRKELKYERKFENAYCSLLVQLHQIIPSLPRAVGRTENLGGGGQYHLVGIICPL
jgi:hypothetical protein